MRERDGALVGLSIDDGVARIRLADPRHRNALSKRLSDDLAAAVGAALAQDARAIVLTAAPPVFCAGGSLEGLLDRTTPLADMYAGMTRLADAPVPTIAAVGGAAIGAGVNLPLACDVVIASPDARFDPRFLDVAIHPGGGHLWRLARRVGSQGAAALVLCGDTLTGREAADRGLAWRCVDGPDLEPTALRLARRAAGRSAPLVRRTKATLRDSVALCDASDAARLELRAQQWSVEQPEFPEAVGRIRQRLRDGETTSDSGGSHVD
ncbi:enoyl-CoA hydratase-related protein [Actinomadura sp. DC4]|uniref:enoyl-CoA hydratase-related protein n=1 Tax=Actinomadura sp. DC4 TaxID=3055069 RepID=UPI0025AF7D6D|nr:enoyl-CoA hydratase-related protein [Actinomadura sp. DC4]MDN3357607.1 enoyl-CoA hydratase-related protein [Actinomadura sp. DC4]